MFQNKSLVSFTRSVQHSANRLSFFDGKFHAVFRQRQRSAEETIVIFCFFVRRESLIDYRRYHWNFLNSMNETLLILFGGHFTFLKKHQTTTNLCRNCEAPIRTYKRNKIVKPNVHTLVNNQTTRRTKRKGE